MGNGDVHPWTVGQEQVMQSIASSLRTIAREVQAQRAQTDVDPESLGALALWRWEVADGKTRLGFSDWLAWHQADTAAKSVRRGMEDLEEATKAEGQP